MDRTPTVMLFLAAIMQPQFQTTVLDAFSPSVWRADGQDARWTPSPADAALESNGDFFRIPSGHDRTGWLAALDRVRSESRERPNGTVVRYDYQGVRAWTRLDLRIGKTLELRPGEKISVTVQVRSLQGDAHVALAFDIHDRKTDAWRRWSAILNAEPIPADREWHTIVLRAAAPDLTGDEWADPIVGEDSTGHQSAASWEMRALRLELPSTPFRSSLAAHERESAATVANPIDRSVYDRPDLAWSRSNFSCYFLFLYDDAFFDRKAGRYRTERWLESNRAEFGGSDSVVLWHAYPRIGVDERNQFDFYRDMPGGLPALRKVVATFRKHGIKVFIDYNPWDVGTRREPITDDEALAEIVKQIDADGVFLDTMDESPPHLRAALDRIRPGLAIEPEVTPALSELAVCSQSWAQWLNAYPEPAIMRLKWIEPRHMRHQIRRWDKDHLSELESAWLNGSGMLVWPNVFGSWNPWPAYDTAVWRHMVPILREFASELSSERWTPGVDVGPDAYASRWNGDGLSLYLVVDRSKGGEPLRLPQTNAGDVVFDLWRGKSIEEGSALAHGFSAIAIATTVAAKDRCKRLIERTRHADSPTGSRLAPTVDPPTVLRSSPVPTVGAAPAGMSFVAGGHTHLKIVHDRRECGCYADPLATKDRVEYFVNGGVGPFDTMTHSFDVSLEPFFVDQCLVSNADYQAFLDSTRYLPKDPTNFLKHWKAARCPTELLDLPVVYVDQDDARAYASWRHGRLPTEAEWQLAAQGGDGRAWPWGSDFDAAKCNGQGSRPSQVRAFPEGRSPAGCYDMTGNVWQWTDETYDDGHTRFAIIRGGCYFNAEGSGWYVRGGAQRCDSHTKFILMGPSLDRCATVGFRCVIPARSGGNSPKSP